MPFEPGRVLLLHFPFTDGTSAKVRPVLVVSKLEFNQGEDFIVVPISSRMSEADSYSIPIRESSPVFESTKLKQASSIKWSKPMTVSGRVVRRKLGIVPPPLLEEVLDRIRGIF